jgi:hypothetical protein
MRFDVPRAGARVKGLVQDRGEARKIGRRPGRRVFATAVVLAVPAAAQANEVTHWNRIAMNTLVAFPGPAGDTTGAADPAG